jgi:glycosyltransferase involved in cell wall biosynthesis
LTTIAIDARAAAEEPAGRGRVVRELLSAIDRRADDNRYLLYARSRWDEELDHRFAWRLRSVPDPLWNLWAALDASRRSDVVLSTNSYLTAWFTSVPTAAVVYDTVAWDSPDSAQRRAQRIERATIRIGLRRAKAAICISESTRGDLVSRFPWVAPKTHVVPLAVNERFTRLLPASVLTEVRSRYALEEEFALFVGTLEPRKNIQRLLEAHSGLTKRVQLVLVGPRGWEFEPILAQARARDEVRVLEEVSDDDLVALYQACAIFCYPSLYEGFGLPLLEAMAAGAACVTSSVSSLPEVGGDAVRYVDPTSVEEIRSALTDLLADAPARTELGLRARERAAHFSWDRTAAGMLNTLLALTLRPVDRHQTS